MSAWRRRSSVVMLTAYSKPLSCVLCYLQTWDLDALLAYARRPNGQCYEFNHLALKTMRQLVAVSAQRISSYHRLSVGDTDEEESYGIRAIAYTPDSTKMVVGFGHPKVRMAYVDWLFMVIAIGTATETE